MRKATEREVDSRPSGRPPCDRARSWPHRWRALSCVLSAAVLVACGRAHRDAPTPERAPAAPSDSAAADADNGETSELDASGPVTDGDRLSERSAPGASPTPPAPPAPWRGLRRGERVELDIEDRGCYWSYTLRVVLRPHRLAYVRWYDGRRKRVRLTEREADELLAWWTRFEERELGPGEARHPNYLTVRTYRGRRLTSRFERYGETSAPTGLRSPAGILRQHFPPRGRRRRVSEE